MIESFIVIEYLLTVIQYVRSSRLADAMLAKVTLNGLDAYYPGFEYWYVNKCLPGVIAGKDLMVVAKDKDRVVGLALGKAGEETKLRCIRVLPEYRNRGVGLTLIERTLRLLDDDKPLCTVSEEMLHQYARPFINLFDFDLSVVEKGMYRPGKLEYVFNRRNNNAPH